MPNPSFDGAVAARAAEIAARSSRPADARGVRLTPLDRTFSDDAVTYSAVEVAIDRAAGMATVTVSGPDARAPASMAGARGRMARATWTIRAARELDDAILHLRCNEPEIGVLVLKTSGDPQAVLAHEALLLANPDDWLAREILSLWKRTLKRLDVTARSLVALVEPGSCFAGLLAELAFAADRSYMAEGAFDGDNRPPASLTLTEANFGPLPMANGLGRLATRFLDDAPALDAARARMGEPLEAEEAEALGLVTFAFDEIDWEDEIRIALEERASFSPDALTGLEANLRFAGPETMETKIFARLSAWQNWIFQRPNATGEAGALKRYGTGRRAEFDRTRT